MSSKAKASFERFAAVIESAHGDPRKLAVAGLVALNGVANVVEAVGHTGTDQERAALKADLIAVYNERIAPLNIRTIPDRFGIEAMFDSYVGALLASGVDAGYEYLAQVRAEVDAAVKAAA